MTDLESPLRWTCKSKEKLAAELRAMGHKVSATMVGRLLHQLGYSLQVVRKTREGKQSPDRNAQFEHINRTAKDFIKRGQPVVSVDTKKSPVRKKSLVLTTNLAFADWHTVFPSATCATALVERVVHHADIVKIDGKSYRLRESEADADSRRASRREKKPSNKT